MNRREWCSELAKLVSPSFQLEATEALHEMLPALQHLPDSLFCRRTLTEVAMAKRRQSVPAFDEIVRALNEYRATYVTDPTMRLAARPNHDLPPDRIPPSPEEVRIVTEMLTSYRREAAENAIRRAEQEPVRKALELPDVTLKGEHLAQSRAARGIKVHA